ncbi:MAG: hypothetical protein Q4C13_02650, partial [Clostridia bacterium]|nr:hypothetical protein [Clostridia bacterium]
ISYMGTVYDIMERYALNPIAIGSSVSGITLPLPVTDAQLGQPLLFTVAWLQGGEPFSMEIPYTIARAANPVISVTRTASADMARQGDTITLTYELRNDTKFDMTDIVLIDEQISDNPILRMDTLKAGGTSTMTHQYRMGSEDAVSAPVVTYVVNGRSKVFSSIEPLTLSMVNVALSMSVDAGVPTAAGVTFTLEIRNTGNQEIRDIQITDERGNPVNSTPFSLAAGETVTYPWLVVPVMTEAVREVSFRLTGTDAFMEPYTLESASSYEVYPFVDDSQISVMLRAETVTPWSSETGTVTARVILTNYSTVTLTNIVVTEATIGAVKTLDSLPAGETAFDQELLVGSPRNLQFSVKGNDPTGTVRELASCLLPVAYTAEVSADPAATPAPQQEPVRAFAFLSTAISKILVVLGVLMVLAFIALVVLSMMERGRGGHIRYDEEDDDDEDDEDDIFSSAAGYADIEEESEAAYFTRRISRAEAQSAGPGTAALPPAILLPEQASSPGVEIEYEAAAPLIDAEAIFSEAGIFGADGPGPAPAAQTPPAHTYTAEPDPAAETDYGASSAQDGLPTPKVIAARRPQPAVRPAQRAQVRRVAPGTDD